MVKGCGQLISTCFTLLIGLVIVLFALSVLANSLS
jgi:hypothetical protein